MAKLEVKNLSKYFDETKVLENININVENGEFVVLVGPSGSGKSTILRIIAGLENPTSGFVEINSKVVNNLHPKERDIAMVFQNYALYPHMNVFDNLAFPLKMKNTNKKQIDVLVNETAELLGINKHLWKLPKQLSGGERQRVALGRAIVRNPKLFLMDEPLSNLDAKLRIQMRSELLKIHKKLSSTIIYVTHDQIEALTMGDKIVVLNNGTIQQIDNPKTIYKDPRNIFVASFIGNPPMNFFDFKLLGDNKIRFLDEVINVGFEQSLLKTFKQYNLHDKDLILGVRPENISIGNEGELKFNAIIDLIEILGDECLIYAFVQRGNKKTNFVVKLSGDYNFKRNDEIKISVDISKVHYFDPSTGKRISI